MTLDSAENCLHLEAGIDAGALDERDRKARQKDAQHFKEELKNLAANQQAFMDLIQKDAHGVPDQGEVREVMHLTSKLGQAAVPYSIEAKFYKAAHRKMASLSSKRNEQTRPWMISHFEVDIEEGSKIFVMDSGGNAQSLFVEIGSGAFSKVYKGKWDGEEIAIKVLLEGTSEKVSTGSRFICSSLFR